LGSNIETFYNEKSPLLASETQGLIYLMKVDLFKLKKYDASNIAIA
jgi:hypothetical protein